MDDLTRKIDAARQKIESLFGRTARFEPAGPDTGRLSKNSDAVAVTQALLKVFTDVEPFVYATSQASAYDLKAHWQIDPAPLVSLNAPPTD